MTFRPWVVESYETHCEYDHVLALSDPLGQLRDLLLQLLGRVEVLFRVVLIARCRCHVG